MEKRTGIRCLICNDVVVSHHRHDMRPCKCGATWIDGGSDYTRYSALDPNKMEFVEGLFNPKTGQFVPNGLDRAIEENTTITKKKRKK